MSTKPTVRNPSIIRLIEDGFEVEIKNQHLLVHSIPYLDVNREVKLGVLACPYNEMGEQDTRPQDHTMWFQAELPYMGSGQPMTQVVNNSNGRELFKGFIAQHYLSNKPNNQPFVNFYDKVNHYHTLFVSQARLIQPNADGRTNVPHRERDQESVFQYPDSASARVGVTAITQKLEGDKIAIVGVGGTGSYILDMLAKTPVSEIHLYDGDVLEPHNAFRSPGAIPFEVLEKKPMKVNYFSDHYSQMHRGVIPHNTYVTSSNLSELDCFDFVFLSLDSGSARKVISEYLIKKGISFIDVGLGIERVEYDTGDVSLQGSCRTTLVSSAKNDHITNHMVLKDDDPEQALYGSNIQVADMNAINAMLAVSRWKQLKGFYHDDTESAHNLIYTMAFQSIARSEALCG
ncbi:ThiF family adenylyltransferase [Vibrio campbellii]|uniref:ThiF family adenylyltransferase n=1 Tax=Vibrio campbellii TaxID=680 RepID=UPI001F07D170|nr:ThiF family adenylyltransferase [Vibrio campbellii]UMM05874.1 ThiF family adenylyltransferase [Vibrio campbellii]